LEETAQKEAERVAQSLGAGEQMEAGRRKMEATVKTKTFFAADGRGLKHSTQRCKGRKGRRRQDQQDEQDSFAFSG
jgi:hypothetical protein